MRGESKASLERRLKAAQDSITALGVQNGQLQEHMRTWQDACVEARDQRVVALAGNVVAHNALRQLRTTVLDYMLAESKMTLALEDSWSELYGENVAEGDEG